MSTYGAEAHNVKILYGGSVKGSNAKEIFSIANVNGALVGGASLKSSDFIEIITAASNSVSVSYTHLTLPTKDSV